MKNRKGFTIVELVIVIAVIAILAAVLIPTFSGVIGKANQSSREQNFTNALKVVLAGNAETGYIAPNTVFVCDGYYAVYNGNKLGDIKAIDDDAKTAINAYQIKSVILPINESTWNSKSLTALATYYGGTTATIGNNKTVTVEGTGNAAPTGDSALKAVENVDLAEGMFVLSPTTVK